MGVIAGVIVFGYDTEKPHRWENAVFKAISRLLNNLHISVKWFLNNSGYWPDLQPFNISVIIPLFKLYNRLSPGPA